MTTKDLKKELRFQTTRSSGKGGQHVNKVETRVELHFDVNNSEVFNEQEKKIISDKLANRISKEGILQLSSQAKRSQLLNKQQVTNKFFKLIEKALAPEKERIPTKPTKAMIAKRLNDKKIRSEKKAMRGKIKLDW